MLPLNCLIQPPFEMWPCPPDNPLTPKRLPTVSAVPHVIIMHAIKEGRKILEWGLLIKITII